MISSKQRFSYSMNFVVQYLPFTLDANRKMIPPASFTYTHFSLLTGYLGGDL